MEGRQKDIFQLYILETYPSSLLAELKLPKSLHVGKEQLAKRALPADRESRGARAAALRDPNCATARRRSREDHQPTPPAGLRRPYRQAALRNLSRPLPEN